MTDEEIEKELLNLCSIDLTDKQNYDNCGRLIIPKYNDIIHKTLDYINRLKAENEKLKDTLNAVENDEINLRGNLEECVDKLEHIRKDTAKEIFQTILDDYRDVDYYSFLFEGLQAIADDEYGIRIMPSENGVSVEMDDE